MSKLENGARRLPNNPPDFNMVSEPWSIWLEVKKDFPTKGIPTGNSFGRSLPRIKSRGHPRKSGLPYGGFRRRKKDRRSGQKCMLLVSSRLL
jgi:hypothetical protein